MIICGSCFGILPSLGKVEASNQFAMLRGLFFVSADAAGKNDCAANSKDDYGQYQTADADAQIFQDE